MKNQTLIKAGFLVPVIFWLTLLIAGLFNPSYNHSIDLVSSLGELGSKTQYFFSAGLITCAVLSIAFIIGMCNILQNLQQPILPIIILVTFPFSVFGAAIFPFPLRIHELFGIPVIVLPLSPVLALITWWKNILSYKFMAFLALLLMLLGFTIYAKGFYPDYVGLKQRIFHAGWSVWFLYLTMNFQRSNKQKEQHH